MQDADANTNEIDLPDPDWYFNLIRLQAELSFVVVSGFLSRPICIISFLPYQPTWPFILITSYLSISNLILILLRNYHIKLSN